MARYCFHFASKDEFVADRRGVDLPSLAAAHAHAVKLIQQTIRSVATGSGLENWKINISDDSGRTPLTVLFPSAATLPEQREARHLTPSVLTFQRTRPAEAAKGIRTISS